MHRARAVGRGQGLYAISDHTTLSPLHLFSNLEALHLIFCDFYGGFLRQDQLLIPLSSPSSPSGGQQVERKILSFYHSLALLVTSSHPGAMQEPTQGHLTRKKDVPNAIIT